LSAVENNVSPYDTLFIEPAKRENIKLTTYDKKLIKSFPRIAVNPEKIV
jgi:predicted nucleic acid-binding protein